MTTPAVLTRLFTQPCRLVQRTVGPPDAYGDPTWIETITDALCYADQGSSGEPGDPHYQADEWRFCLDADTPLSGVDAIELGGRRFEVIGPPWPAHNPRTNTTNHVELRARVTTP